MGIGASCDLMITASQMVMVTIPTRQMSRQSGTALMPF
jgi:hypothetical protein